MPPLPSQLTFIHFSNEPGTQEGKIARHESQAPDYQERKTQLKTHTLQGFFPHLSIVASDPNYQDVTLENSFLALLFRHALATIPTLMF